MGGGPDKIHFIGIDRKHVSLVKTTFFARAAFAALKFTVRFNIGPIDLIMYITYLIDTAMSEVGTLNLYPRPLLVIFQFHRSLKAFWNTA